ncbi:MAG: 4-alpha-glucanotransferase [Candidatus Manganitrophus sp.]|nr:MAG: 4-alpha-glucanotransferase [Candidatus Manganitrophus sp.]
MRDHPDQHTLRPASLNRKICGTMIPLFSIRTETNFGIGEILDLPPLIDWMADHHLHLLQILPVYETSPMETSPYQALSGFALDPIYLSLLAWNDFKKSDATNGIFSSPSTQETLHRLRANKDVSYEAIRRLKAPLLEQTFRYFLDEEWKKNTDRARALQRFIDAHSDWLEDYALFRLLKEKNDWRYWKEWPAPYRNRSKPELKKLQDQEEERLLFFKYLQWALAEQWKEVREHAKRRNVLLMGDLPFLVSGDSADVWSHPHSFSAVDSVGAPPDVFNDKGQDWGLPLFNWNVMEKRNFLWWRLRIRQAREHYDLIRLDHVVGFYRVWVIPKDGAPHFEPSEENEQIKRGRQLLSAIIEEAGMCIPVAEDLGVIPDFVRETLAEFKIAGHKVLRWEKRDQVYLDPKDYPFISLATTGTHDTSTIMNWWEEISLKERAAFLAMLDEGLEMTPEEPFSDRLHKAILERLIRSGSSLVLFPIQDILGLPDQINIPATVGLHNWRFRLPAPLHELDRIPPFHEKLTSFTSLIDRHLRYAGSEPLLAPPSPP